METQRKSDTLKRKPDRGERLRRGSVEIGVRHGLKMKMCV